MWKKGEGRKGLENRLREPIEVFLVAAFDFQGDELGGVVRVFRHDQPLQCREPGHGGFENQQDFGASLDFALPPVMGFDFRNQIGAGYEAGR